MEIGNLIFGHSRGTYEVPRGHWQDRFCKFLDNIGCDYYGIADDQDNPHVNARGGITTKLFCVNPYYWGDDEREIERPNFIYHPTGYSLMWYKYPLRDSYANHELTYEDFDSMLTDCEVYFNGRCNSDIR